MVLNEPLVMLVIVTGVFAGLLRGYAPDVIMLGAAVLCGLLGILEPEEVFNGFANGGMLTVAALFVVAAGLRETGAINLIGSRLFAKATTEQGVMRRMTLVVTSMSAFMNNTPIVAIFIPIITKWCRDHRVSPSRFLMFLSYVSIFGGMCTLIGTSTNIIVSDLMMKKFGEDPKYADLEGLGLFELAWVGVPFALLGILYLMTIGRRLLPTRVGAAEQLGLSWREYLVNMRIQEGCGLDGKTVTEGGLRHLQGLFLIEVTRQNEVFSPVSPEQRLEEGDILTFTGAVETIVDLQQIPGLLPLGDEEYDERASERRNRLLCEAVVSNTSPLVGRTVRASNFRARYNAAVVAVHRGRQRLKGRVGDIVIQNGDTLLLQVGPHFSAAHRNNTDFFLVSSVEDSRAVRHERAGVSLFLFGLLVILLAAKILPPVLAAFLVAGLMVATRCLSASIAHQSIDIRTLVTIGAAFGLGEALVSSGCVDLVAQYTVNATQDMGPRAVLAAILIVTSVFTSMITNNAAALLMFPFAITIALDIGVSPRPFAIAVALGASSCFITPLGYQTNLMVYGPGGYKFTDFLRVGLPLNILLILIGVLLVPAIWPFETPRP